MCMDGSWSEVIFLAVDLLIIHLKISFLKLIFRAQGEGAVALSGKGCSGPLSKKNALNKKYPFDRK